LKLGTFGELYFMVNIKFF